MTVLKHRADLVSVVETVNAGTSVEENAWLDATREACAALFDRARGVGLHVLTITPDLALAGDHVSATAGVAIDGAVARIFAIAAPSDLRALYFPPSPVTTLSTLRPDLGPGVAALTTQWLAEHDATDALLIVMHPVPDRTLLLWAALETPVALERRERTALTQLALHIEAGYRVRSRPEAAVAELAEDGQLLWRAAAAPHASILEAHAARVNRARAAEARVTFEGLELWTALVAGKVSLVPRRVEGRRRYVVLENTPMSAPLRQLTDDERAIVGLAARGISTKLVAYALGVSSSLVSLRLALAAGKLGVGTRAELVRIAALLAADHPAPSAARESVVLTDAERDVLALLQRGLSNRQIAEARARSVRTVANQVASLLKKTGSSTRRALVVRDAALALLPNEAPVPSSPPGITLSGPPPARVAPEDGASAPPPENASSLPPAMAPGSLSPSGDLDPATWIAAG